MRGLTGGNIGHASRRGAATPEPAARLVLPKPMSELMLRQSGDYDLACERSLRCFVPADVARMKGLLELGFGRKLADGYMDKDDFIGVIVEREFKSIALVRGIEGIPYSYLCKFATDPEKRGNGVGLAVWSLLKIEYPELIWRTGNGPDRTKTNEWYAAHGAQGPIPIGEWNVYWSGIREENAAIYAPLVAAIPVSFATSK